MPSVEIYSMYLNYCFYRIMAHSHCTGTGQGTMGLCILLCTVHTTEADLNFIIDGKTPLMWAGAGL